MKKLLLMLTLGLIATNASALDGLIRVDDGRSIVRISIGDENQSKRVMARRIRRLEEAVRDLQDQVYDLQTGPVNVEQLYTCSARVCRKSTSFHGTSGNNCTFFGYWKNETFNVYAERGSEANKIAQAQIDSDRDIARVSNTPSCLPAGN